MEKTKTIIGNLGTEARNPRTMELDRMSSLEMATVIMNEESRVILACLKTTDQLARAIDLYAEVLSSSGRIIESGSGCSGDYAFCDVMELAATFGQKATGDIDNDKVLALHAQRGWWFNPEYPNLVDQWAKDIKVRDFSEDSLDQPLKDMERIKFGKNDLIVLITASGRSPFIVELAKEAKKRHGKVISIVMNTNTEIAQYSDVVIEAIVGQPPLTGSGRTLAGTASKILITTLSTAAHARVGAVYSNLMVNLNVKQWQDNSKFVDRATRIIQTICNVSHDEAFSFLKKADWDIKVACIMIIKKVDLLKAQSLLKNSNGNLRKVIG